MTNREVVELYFDTFRTKDIEMLKSILSQDFGLRSFLKGLITTSDGVVDLFSKYDCKGVKIISYEEVNDSVFIDIDMLYEIDSIEYNQNLIVKFVIINGRIKKVYEVVKKEGYSRIKCIVTYDGSTYSGFQRQPNKITIQGEIEKALKDLTKEEISIFSSGRTDKGVHAINQVFHFDTLSKIEPNDFARVLRYRLPDSIYLKSSELVRGTFHSRFDAYSKEYIYKINVGENDPIQRNYEWNAIGIDINILKRELQSITGKHDFTSFTKTNDKTMIRTILGIDVITEGKYLYISITGTGFLRYMVRYLVGTAVEIAKGDLNDTLLSLISYKDSSRVLWKAPSFGLYLNKVKYNK